MNQKVSKIAKTNPTRKNQSPTAVDMRMNLNQCHNPLSLPFVQKRRQKNKRLRGETAPSTSKNYITTISSEQQPWPRFSKSSLRSVRRPECSQALRKKMKRLPLRPEFKSKSWKMLRRLGATNTWWELSLMRLFKAITNQMSHARAKSTEFRIFYKSIKGKLFCKMKNQYLAIQIIHVMRTRSRNWQLTRRGTL